MRRGREHLRKGASKLGEKGKGKKKKTTNRRVGGISATQASTTLWAETTFCFLSNGFPNPFSTGFDDFLLLLLLLLHLYSIRKPATNSPIAPPFL